MAVKVSKNCCGLPYAKSLYQVRIIEIHGQIQYVEK